MTVTIPAWIDGALRPVEKLEVHKRGLRHLAVSVFVIAGNEVLIQKRAASKYHTPGLWANTCCTHPHWGESSLDCATRRLNEELGISGLAPVYRHRVEYEADVGKDMIENEVVDVFVAEALADLPVAPDPGEVESTRWVGLYDLAAEAKRYPDHFTPWLKIYLEDHMPRIFGATVAI